MILDMDARRVIDGNRESARLSHSGVSLLARLAQDQGRPVLVEHLLRVLYPHGYSGKLPEDSIRQVIGQVRRAIETCCGADAITTRLNRGYELTIPLRIVARVAVEVDPDIMGWMLPALAARKAIPAQRIAR